MTPIRPIALTLLLLLIAASCFGLEIRLRELVLAKGDMVTLGEVAELDASAGRLADLRLLTSPAPGQEHVVSVDRIKTDLLQRAPDLGEILWSGASSVKIRRDSMVVDQPVIEEILADYLHANRGFLPQARISFKALRFPPTFFLPRGPLTTEVLPSDPQILNSRRFSIIFRIDGVTVENLSIRGELEAIAPVVVAATELSRGGVLSSRDLNLVEMNIVGLRNPCFELDELVGKKLKRSLRQGVPLDRGTVEFPPMVARGELVAIILRHGSMELTARGEARQDGQSGETIRVRNNASQRDILGRVAAPGIIEVEY
ncbi:MAG: flagella basal body P-ring formation protein FlgA [Desulfuromonadaceae bacterium GWC2_58_13]|nr:MAG: flagella basal body P-ring formation protein FlgA [Desulfuromonadaceae bacterium GWC2_58_13]